MESRVAPRRLHRCTAKRPLVSSRFESPVSCNADRVNRLGGQRACAIVVFISILAGPMVEAARMKPPEVAKWKQKIADVQKRSGQLSSYKGLTLMKSLWPIGATRDPENPVRREIGLYRIIGNPLPPRHDINQLHDNLKYMLENEQPLKSAKKIFVLNRLNSSLDREVTAMIEFHGHETLSIPFSFKQYMPHQMEDTYGLSKRDWGKLVSDKFAHMNANLYLMNNNGARNAALRHGIRKGWRWTLPFDGNCFFTPKLWNALLEELETAEKRGQMYAAVPMLRTKVVNDVLDENNVRSPSYLDSVPSSDKNGEHPRGLATNGDLGEHQLAFHWSAQLRFDPTAPYGHRPKVSMLWKLGIPGPWDGWNHDTVFRAEGSCRFLGGERSVKPPSVCARTLPAVDEAAAKVTFSTKAIVFRLPDAWPRHQREAAAAAAAFFAAKTNGTTEASGETVASRANRRDLRDEGVRLKISVINTAMPSSSKGAEDFIKPLFFNVFSMEAMRRECLIHRAEQGTTFDGADSSRTLLNARGAVDEHHCSQMEALFTLADSVIANTPMSVVHKIFHIGMSQRPLSMVSSLTTSGKLRGEDGLAKVSRRPFSITHTSARLNTKDRDVPMYFPTPPRNVTPHHFQNIGPYDWRLAELPWTEDELGSLDLHRIQPIHNAKHGPAHFLMTTNKEMILDPAFRAKHAEEFVKWDGHVRPDGKLWGPGSEAYDRTRAYEMMTNVTMYALAHFYSGDIRFSKKAVSLIRTWFLDKPTRMEPTMAFAHWSRPSNHMVGVMQLKDLVYAFDALALIMRSKSWTENDTTRMRDWCSAYLDDLDRSSRTSTTTKNGSNNHGWWFVMQYASVARCAGRNLDEVADIIETNAVRLIRDPSYHREDGVMPKDMTKSRALHNHFFTSYALVLAWRALNNAGRDVEKLTHALKCTVDFLNTAVVNHTAARRLDLDGLTSFDDEKRARLRGSSERRLSLDPLGPSAFEYATPLCQWALDADFEFGSKLQICERQRSSTILPDIRSPPLPSAKIERFSWPPLLPTAPHSGIFPFMNLMW